MLSGKVALVTGGGSGIGRAICRQLAKDGAKVVATDVNHEAAQETVSMLINPTDHLALNVDVANKSSVDSVIKSTLEKLGSPPSLVANAAGITRDNFLLQMDEKAFMEVFDVNVKGTFLVTQAAALAMVEHNVASGSIVNISSISAEMGNIGQCNYAASKAAVVAFTKSSAQELSKVGMRVNCVLPGFIRTPMVETVPEKVQNMVVKMTPLKRMGEPEEIAEMVAFLLSDKSSFMTGACIKVSGGMAM